METCGSACGCGPSSLQGDKIYASPSASEDEPIVCTANLGDKPSLQAQIDGYRAVFVHLVSTERFPGGFRWLFAFAPELAADIRLLAENEHHCCGFLEFDVRVRGDCIVWETKAGEAAQSVLDEFSRLPERLREELRRGHDVSDVKRRTTAAGLVFASDAETAE